MGLSAPRRDGTGIGEGGYGSMGKSVWIWNGVLRREAGERVWRSNEV